MTITLYENFRAVFYAPFYAVEALGLYRQEGLDVHLETSEAPLPIPARDENGVWWGGPMRLLVGRDQDPNCDLVGFCEVVTRDPFFLVGYENRPAFKMSDLIGCSVATVSEVPTPWMCLQDDIRRAGLDPNDLNRIQGRVMDQNTLALRNREVDVIQVFEPFATQLAAEGSGHIWYASASRGPTSYTTLFANRRTLVERRQELLAMTRAIFQMQKWLQASDAETVATTIAPYFPSLDLKTLTGSIDRYKSLGVWSTNPIVSKDGFERLKGACLTGGLIAKAADYDDCVDVELARAVME